MPILGALFFGFIPALINVAILNWLDRYEKEPKLLLAFMFFWGFAIASFFAFIFNTLGGLGVYMFTNSESATDFMTASVFAPIVEESLKGLAVLMVFLFFRKEFDSILDGMIYAGIAGLGFAATENAYYIYTYGYADGGWSQFWFLVFVRVVLVGWQHPFYAAFTGIGLAASRLARNGLAKLAAPVAGWTVAVVAHSFHNTFAGLVGGYGGLAIGTLFDWTGWFFMFLFAVWMIRREGILLSTHLREEVGAGILSAAQLQKAASPFGSLFASLRGRAARRFYQVCGELAHKKEQYSLHGDEGGNLALIQSLRNELAALSPRVRV